MGCIHSQPDDDIERDIDDADLGVTKKVAAKQRRRLSVTPGLVGDITQSHKEQVSEEHPANATLNDAEVKAKGSMLGVAKTKKGFVPYNKNKVNQDRALLRYALQEDPDLCLFGVADGHGEFGHYVSAFVQDKLPQYLEKETKLKEDPRTCILSAVKGMVDELDKTNIDIQFSGTTLVFGVKVKDTMYTANLGDSRCVLAQTIDGKLKALGLSEDQKPENKGEKERILAAGGRVHPLPGDPGEDCGPDRVWLGDVDVPGLAMSRSVGDGVAKTVGVIAVPEITEHKITADDAFMIWASDGVWEFISNQDAVDIVAAEHKDIAQAATNLVVESDKRWKAEEEVVDDITCVIVAFKDFGPTESISSA